MSDEKNDIMEWFRSNYPVGRYVLDEVSKHVSKIRIYCCSNLSFNSFSNINICLSFNFNTWSISNL